MYVCIWYTSNYITVFSDHPWTSREASLNPPNKNQLTSSDMDRNTTRNRSKSSEFTWSTENLQSPAKPEENFHEISRPLGSATSPSSKHFINAPGSSQIPRLIAPKFVQTFLDARHQPATKTRETKDTWTTHHPTKRNLRLSHTASIIQLSPG